MRLAIISDIHGNCVALDAVVADLDRLGPDKVICLGDAIQSGPQPHEVVARLRERQVPTVMGNADAWLLTGNITADEGHSDERMARMEEIRLWSLEQLTDEDKAYIAGFSPTIEVPLSESENVLCFHGSPSNFDEVLLPQDSTDRFASVLGGFDARYFCGGHTHVQFVRHVGRGFFFNPGSVGVAYRHDQPDESFRLDPWAEYAVLTTGTGLSLEFRRVPFEVNALLEVYRRSGRPHYDYAAKDYER